MKTEKVKYPNKDKIYSVHNFLKQFSQDLLPNFFTDFDEASDSMSNWLYEKDETQLAFVKEKIEQGFIPWTVRDNNDGKVMRVDQTFGYVNCMGYFLIKQQDKK